MKHTKIIAVIMAAAVICCVFAACKKDPGDELSSTEGSSRSAWLDETLSSEEAPPTEVVTDENGETKVVEYETDAQGEIATEADGQKVTKAPQTNGNEDPANPVNGNTTTTTTKANNQGNTTTTTTRPHTTTTTRPNTTTTTTQPAPPPPPVPAELTEADKEAMINDLMAYARQVGYLEIYKNQVGDGVYTQFIDVTPKNYNSCLSQAKTFIQELCGGQFAPNKIINFQWGIKEPNTLYIYME